MKLLHCNALKVAALAMLVAGCGGGGGSDGAGPNPPPVTGTSRSVLVTGAIAGFGSVIVNGVHYDTDSAEVSIEDKAATAADLEVDEVIHMQADVDSQGVAHA